ALSDVPPLFFQQSAETQADFRAIYGDAAALAWAAEHGAPPPVSLVSIWQTPPDRDIPPVPPPVTPPFPRILAWWWGTVPLLLLVLAGALVVIQSGGSRLSRPGAAPARPRPRRALALPSIAGTVLGRFRA